MSLPFFRRKNLSSHQSQIRLAKKRPAFRLDPILQLEERAVPASLIWDGNSATLPNPNGGTGTWDTSTTNWWNGSTNVTWPAVSTLDDDAVFGLNPGTVSLNANLNANDMAFNASGYLITGSGNRTLTLDGTTPTVTVGAGLTATINTSSATAANSAILAGTAGLTKNGNGTLLLRWSNAGGADNNTFVPHTFTGGVVVNGGTLQIQPVSNNDTSLKTNIINSANSLTLAGGTYSQGPSGDNFAVKQ
ncbi:MAG: hypothetical protein WCL32_18290, partial [Planctomycetota bacterium]